MPALVRKRRMKPGIRLLTAADLAEFPDELPSGPLLYELDNGELIVLPIHDDTHAAVECAFAAEVQMQGENQGLGKARCGGVGVILWRNPDRVVGADVAFIAKESLPIRVSPEDYLETIPDLIVEVRGIHELLQRILAKVKDYLLAGIRVVLVADPVKKTVTAYRRGRKPKVFVSTDTLTVDDVIPGFQMSVAEVFHV